jgi:hypothetical protein
MSNRTRLALVVGIAVLCFVAAGGYLVYTKHRQDSAAAAAPPVPTLADFSSVAAQPHLLFRNTALGKGYGNVAAVPLTDAGGPRVITPASCDRVYGNPAGAICLTSDRGLTTTYKSEWLSPTFAHLRDLPLSGLPSRARVSADGSMVATTTFVFGDAYTNPGQFSTRTLVSQVDGSSNVDLETFGLLIDGKPNTASDRNLWGVTFAGPDHFFATAATGGKTYLVSGQLSTHTLTAVHTDVECPSLSPDHTKIAFKQHGSLPPGHWRLAVLDLSSGKVTQLAEQRSVDDQAEWLDGNRILYGLPQTTAGSAGSDIWVVPADGTGTPQILVHDAWSPSVVRN